LLGVSVQEPRPDIPKLVDASSFIFTGTVVELGKSTVANLAARANFAVIRIERSLRSDPALGNLRDRLVTVALLERGELQPNQRAVFFTLDWIHGGGIAAREISHVDARFESEVDSSVEQQPRRHLADRLGSSVLVIVAKVVSVKPTPFDVRWRNAPQWAVASLESLDALRGRPTEGTTIMFPTSGRPTWALAPRLSEGQRSIFLLHRPPSWAPLPESPQFLTSEAFTLLDPADVQPESQRRLIEELLDQVGAP